jgi:NAD-dependent dihydropyrimidine dehydrogenase PreA subunit
MYIIKIDIQKCTGDGECVETCPSTIFELQEVEGKKVAVISGDMGDCLGCESCVTLCPSEAITLTEA